MSGEVDAWMCSRVAPAAPLGSGIEEYWSVSGSGASRPKACAKLTAAGPAPPSRSSTTMTNDVAV